MTHRAMAPPRTFTPECDARFRNLLVSGCSFSHNISNLHVSSWPYYLRDLANIEAVLDVSMPGAGSQHIFNSVLYECETNGRVTPQDTLVMVMWSGLTRTDVIMDREVSLIGLAAEQYVHAFNERFVTHSIPNWTPQRKEPHVVSQMQKFYKLAVDTDAQILQSLLNIVALEAYLQQRGWRYIFMSWKDPAPDLERVPGVLSRRVASMLTDVVPLGVFADGCNGWDNTQHPSIHTHLAWTRQCLLPALAARGLTQNPDAV